MHHTHTHTHIHTHTHAHTLLGNCKHSLSHTHTHTYIYTHNSHTLTHTPLSHQLFDLIRSERPSALEKVVPISGDCGEPGLGVGESDQELLAENVSVIFHLAATIKFDEPIRSVEGILPHF